MPRSLIPVLALSLLQGCWRDLEPTVTAGVPFTNPNARTQSGVVLTFEPSPALPCPDGKPARFYVLYNESKTQVTEPVESAVNPSDTADTGETPLPDTDSPGEDEEPGDSEPAEPAAKPSPVALILHSSTFDYALNPTPEAPIGGDHFRPGIDGDTRMSRDWGIQKVWATLGLGDSIDSTEQNDGSLPAALVDEGVVGVLPINCWGDLWHNDPESAPNDLVADLGVNRTGHTMAWWMIRILNDLEFALSHNAQINLNLDPSELYLVGLGDGSRGVLDLLQRDDMPAVKGVLLDAPVADLSHWSADDFPGEHAGLKRIYNFAEDDPERLEPNWWTHSIRSLVSSGKFSGVHTALLYSDADPRIPFPDSHYTPLVSSLSNQPTTWIQNVGESAHVFSNANEDRARAVVEFLQTGVIPADPSEETDTGETAGGDTDSSE
ncbi:MAG: hypothetical protein VX519_04635 [Myxococcota bacterium]|nr:hypothetical protein [Myxococcota bacterium]